MSVNTEAWAEVPESCLCHALLCPLTVVHGPDDAEAVPSRV